MPTAPVIRVSHLTKRFGAQVVVDNLSFDVAAGETLVLLGPSGCGKTTLLKTLNHLVEPDGGTIEINGRDVRRQPPEALRRSIGYVIQQVGLLPHYSVAQNIGVVPGLLGWPAARTAARTTELLERLHLPAARFGPMLPAQLSGGQAQRVGLARALAADPPVVLLDEPFGALDPITRAAVRRDFRELDELRRKTVVLVTHDVPEAFELADRIMLLDQGNIQQLGPPRALLLHPANDFVRRFFEADKLALLLRVLTGADLAPYLPAPVARPASLTPAQVLAPTTSIQELLAALDTALPAADSPTFFVDSSTKNVGDSTENVNPLTKNVGISTKNVNSPTENVNSPTKSVGAFTENVNDLTENVGDSTKNVGAPTKNAGPPTPGGGGAAPGPAPGPAAPAAAYWLAGTAATGQPLTLPLLLAAFGHLLAALPGSPHAHA